MEPRRRKVTEEKRKLPDVEINVAAITPDAQRTRKDGGAQDVFTMDTAFFKTVSSPPVRLVICDGRIGLSALGEAFGLDPKCILLNGAICPNDKQNSWEAIKDLFKQLGQPVGTEDAPIIVTAVVQAVSTRLERALDTRYRQFAPSSMNARIVRRVQIPEGSELGPLYKCGRPVDAAGLEAPLMHPAFGSFVQNLRNSSLPTGEDYAFVREFCQKSSEFYKNEHDRQTVLVSLLSIYLKRSVDPRRINNFFEVDGYIGRSSGFPVYSIIEVENELGSTTADKFFEGQRYYAEFCHTARDSDDSSAIFMSCNYPAFLVEFRGVQMRVSAMAYFDRVHTSMLTDLVNISWPSENLPHIFRAFKIGLDSLESFYEQVERGGITSTRGDWLEMVVPYPVWWNPRYTFKRVLYQSSDSEKHMLLAEDNQKRMVVIKFSRRYGAEVHRAWYTAGFAPELLDVEELAGGFKMIAMEYLGPEWQTLVLLDTETKERARVVVREALQEVHKLRVFDSTDAGSVHGDVRDVNIMVRSNGMGFDVRFVDFDWAGQESVSTYPPNMNHVTIAWPKGVVDGEPMLQRHDMDVLNSSGLASYYDWRKFV